MRNTALALAASLMLLASQSHAQDLQARVTTLFNLGSEPFDDVTEGPGGRFYYLWVDEFDTQRIQYPSGSSVPIPLPCSGHGTGILNRAGDRLAYECWHDHPQEPTQIWTVGVDSVRGLLTGTPRRVSIKGGEGPAFSPDSRFISYTRYDSGSTVLVSVPATGGDEQVLARVKGTTAVQQWSPDGRFVYFDRYAQSVSTVERVNVTGGTVEPVADGSFIGFSRDGRVFATETRDRVHIEIHRVDGTLVGRFTRPADASLEWSSTRSTQMIGTVDLEPEVLTSLTIANGQSKVLPGSTANDLRPQYTPDGKHIVFLHATGDDPANHHYRLMRANVDGSQMRALPTSVDPASGWLLVSPDSRYVAFTASNGTIQLFDLTTGKDRTLPTDDAAQFRWRSDSKALIYFKAGATLVGGARAIEVRQIALNGADSLVRDITLSLSKQAVYLVNDTLVTWTNNTGILAISLRSGRIDTVFHGSALTYFPYARGGGQSLPVSPDGKWLAFVVKDSGARAGQPYLMSIDGKQTRPIGRAMCDGRIVAWLPNGRDVIEQGKPDCEAPAAYGGGPSKVYLVPLNGDPIRNLTASDRSASIDGVVLSPDGSRLLFTGTQTRNVSLIQVDITIPPPRE